MVQAAGEVGVEDSVHVCQNVVQVRAVVGEPGAAGALWETREEHAIEHQTRQIQADNEETFQGTEQSSGSPYREPSGCRGRKCTGRCSLCGGEGQDPPVEAMPDGKRNPTKGISCHERHGLDVHRILSFPSDSATCMQVNLQVCSYHHGRGDAGGDGDALQRHTEVLELCLRHAFRAQVDAEVALQDFLHLVNQRREHAALVQDVDFVHLLVDCDLDEIQIHQWRNQHE